MRCRKVLLQAIALSAALAASSAKLEAADLLGTLFSGDSSPTATQPVDFGTGWYIRGDAAFADDSIPDLSPDPSQFLSNVRQANVNLDLGFGYKFTSWLRADATIDWWKPNTASGIGAAQGCTLGGVTSACTPNYNSNLQSWDLLGNLYADIGTWYGITPYVGGGAGLSLLHASSGVDWTTEAGALYQATAFSSTCYQFAWAAMAGFSYAITPNILLDVGYRYINLGNLSSLPDLNGTIVTKTIDAHELRLGLRYVID